VVVIQQDPNNIYIAYVAIVLMALAPIWIGARRSLTSKFGAETMTAKDAYMFPIVGSGVLFGLYMLFKIFSKEYINMLLTAYFLLFGVIAVATTFAPIMHSIMPPARDTQPWEFNIHFPWDKDPTHLKFYVPDVIAAIIGIIVGVCYLTTKHWIVSNILGLCFSISGITYLSLGSYKVGAILLCGLFVYDIFWVFGTDVMVTVAKSFDAPIKLLFPRDIFAAEYKFSMLGLGDIVIPGFFLALLLRFDRSRAANANDTNFPRPYFNATFVSYIIGLVTTIFIMHFFQAAQPALLYLVPACLGSSLLVGVMRGELEPLFKYNEEETPVKRE